MGCFKSKQSRPADAGTRLAAAGLTVLRPSDAEYSARQESYWSNSAKLAPACIVRPRNAKEVATAVKTLAAAADKFAVRSGGHTQWAGSNNIDGGVTIDLGLLAWTRVDGLAGTVDVGPGGVWSDVYRELQAHGRVVAGGREGNVGVAGLILGGGNTFYTPRYGFACDNVVAFEVVLGSGAIVTADPESYPDLYWALKGGSSNFGIVTNFKMRTFESRDIWAGLTFYPKQVTQPAVQALTDFTDAMHEDLDSNLLCFFAYTPEFKDVGIATMSVQVAGVERAPAYKKWLELPSILTTCKRTTVTELVSDPAHNLPRQYHNVWFTATFKNDPCIVAKAASLHEAMVEEFKTFIPDGDFWTQCLFQPFPKIFGQRSAEAGGNAMGVERQQQNGLLFQAAAMVRTPEQERFAYAKVKVWIEAVRNFAEATDNGDLGWVYLNYADRSQDPLGSYGIANVKRLREVARTYDPGLVFQTLCPGGFKISDANV